VSDEVNSEQVVNSTCEETSHHDQSAKVNVQIASYNSPHYCNINNITIV